jgi:hypothetical protein
MTQPFKKRERVKLSDIDPAYPDHTWTFWASPSVPVYAGLLDPFVKRDSAKMSREDVDAERLTYEYAVSELVLDTGESEIDLSTPEAVRQAFQSTGIDTELLGSIILAYSMRIYQRREEIQKKVLAQSNGTHGR